MSGIAEWLRAQPGRCVGCGMHVKAQGCVCAPVAPNLTGKRNGQAQASAAHPSDRAAVDAAIRTLVARGGRFSSNDARALHNVRGGVVGAAFTAAARAGVIKRVGYEPSTDPGTNAHPVAIWEAAA